MNDFIDKKEALRRLIVSSISMFFTGCEDLATHVVASAASTVSMNLCEHTHPMENTWKVFIKNEFHGKFFAALNKSVNFLKHADKDTGDTLDISKIRDSNRFLILNSLIHFEKLHGNIRDFRRDFFFVYMISLKPELLNENSFSGRLASVMARMESLRGDRDKDEFFREQYKLVGENIDAIYHRP